MELETGLNDVFVINTARRGRLIARDASSADVIKPLVQGTHLRPWYVEHSDEFLIFARRGIEIDRYPAVLEYLSERRREARAKAG